MFKTFNTREPIDLGDLSTNQRHHSADSSRFYSLAKSRHTDDDESTKGLRDSMGTDTSKSFQKSRTDNNDYSKHRWSPGNAASWSLERICICLSLASMLSLLGIFIRFQGRPLTEWNFYFSVNTVASTLGTIAKSTLLLTVGAAIGQGKWQWYSDEPRPLIDFDTFDEASRGPLGSLSLMWTLKFRHLAAIGGLVTVLSAASDPFLQAVVSYTGRLDTTYLNQPGAVSNIDKSGTTNTTNTKTSIARSERWASFDSFAFVESTERQLDDGNTYPMSLKRQDFSTSAAFYTGIVSANIASPQFDCWTGNCTAPIFTSLAVCSQCKDITAAVESVAVLGDNVPEAILRSSENLGEARGPLTNFTLPNIWTDNFGGNGSGYTSLMEAALNLDPNHTNVFKDDESLLAAITMMRYNGVAIECALYLCVNAYQSTVTNGTLEETIINSWSERVPASYAPRKEQPYAVNITNPGAIHSDTWTTPYQAGYLNRTDYQLCVPTKPSGLPAIGNTSVFNISQAAITTFQDFLNGMFTSTAFTDINSTAYPVHELAYGFKADPLYTSPVLQPLLASTDLDATFANIAKAMTNTIRNSGNGLAQPFTAQQWVLHIEILWGFFVYPFATTVLGCFYALYTIQRTKHRGLPAWKTSVLASLTHGINGDIRETLKEMPLNGQRDVAKRSLVSLKERDGVVELRESQGEHYLS